MKPTIENKMERRPPRVELRDLLGVVMLLLTIGIGSAIALQVVDKVDDNFTAGSREALAAANTTEAISTITENLPTLALVLIMSAILVALVVFLFRRVAGA